MNELHLFAGSGGGILGGLLLGHRPVCAVEFEKDARDKLIQRQREGALPWFPIWDDVCTFDGKPWKGIADIVCGGFPCQDISPAGFRRGIQQGTRSGLWAEMARIIHEVGPLRSSETWKDTSRLSHRLIGLWKNFAGREMNGRIKKKIACHPTFAEWMMNWPEMWSGSQELEMDKFQAWLHLHSKHFQENKSRLTNDESDKPK